MNLWVLAVMVMSTALIRCNGDDDAEALFGSDDEVRLTFHNQIAAEDADLASVNFFAENFSSPFLEKVPYSRANNVPDPRLLTLDDVEDGTQVVEFDVTRSATGNSLVKKQQRLSAGDAFTVVAMGDPQVETPLLQLYPQVPADVPSDQVRVRFINAVSRQAGDRFDLFVNGAATPLVSDFRFAESSAYFLVSTGSTLTVDVNRQDAMDVIDGLSCSVSQGDTFEAVLALDRFDSATDELALFCREVDDF